MRDRMRAGLWLVGGLGALTCLSHWNGGVAGSRRFPTGLPRWGKTDGRSDSGESDPLGFARRARRERGRRAAIRAYTEVAEDPRVGGAPRVEALFRRAELLRAEGELEGALGCFETLAAMEDSASFGDRSHLECAAILRRLGRSPEACQHWLALWIDVDAEGRLRSRAGRALGEAHAEAGEWDAALRVLGAVVRQGFDPLEQVRAYDAIAELWLQRGDLEAAAGVLHEADVALGRLASERTQLGSRVREALAEMDSLHALKEAIALRVQETSGTQGDGIRDR